MSHSEFSISLNSIIDEFHLQRIYEATNIDDVEITTMEINRPGMQIVGYFSHFDSSRLQLMGMVEISYLRELDSDARLNCFDKLFATKIPALIITRSYEIFPELLEMAKKHDVTVLRSDEPTSPLMSSIISYLSVQLAPRITRHGVLIEVHGEGVLILGESGIGKSEAAIELVKRGHRFVADDAVEIKKVSSKTLVACAPEMIRYFIELRGIGIVDIRRLFGTGAVKETEKIDMVIHLEQWDKAKKYDRLGLVDEYTNILGINIPSITIPVRPGRNLAIIIETAAMNNRQKRAGYNAAEDLNNRLMSELEKNSTQ